MRFRQSDGSVRIVLVEWKYTELYTNGESIRFSSRGTDRPRNSEEIRIFAFSRMSKVRVTERTFSILEDFSIDDYMDRNFKR